MENITNNNKQDERMNLHYSVPSLPLSEQKGGLDLSMFALDLSCKNNTTQSEISKERINLIMSLSQTLPQCAKRRYQEINLPEEQTPIAGSSTMLSPYSESNSPKRMRIESMDHYENSSQHNATNMRDITPNMIMVTPQQPVSNIPGTETSQPFITYNEAVRNIPLPAEYSTEYSTNIDAILTSLEKKASRPFKVYPKNILSIVPSLNSDSNEKFAKFREIMLENVKKMHGNTPNPKMRRVARSPGLPTSTEDDVKKVKDPAYLEKRKKNNEAAKRSRQARRAKEDDLAIRAAYLEHENAQLKREIQRLHFMYSSRLCRTAI